MAPPIDRLTVRDVQNLAVERPGLPMQIGALGSFDAGPLLDDHGELRIEALRAAMAARLHLVPRLRRVVVKPPWWQGRPIWVDDAAFDITRHVRRVSLAPPGDESRLLRLCDELHLELLDRRRPLWELCFVTGLADGQVVLIERLHHALADGLAGVDVSALLLDTSPDVAAGDPQTWTPQPGPPGRTLFADNLRGRLAAAAHLLGHVRDRRRAPDRGGGLPRLAARTSLLRRIGLRRRLVLVRRSLADVKAVAHAHDATVNDVILTAVAGGLRNLLLARGERVSGVSLVASVPVSLRSDADRHAGGNVSSVILVPLPVGEADTVRRLERIRDVTRELKRHRGLTPYDRLLGSDLTPAWLQRLFGWFALHQRFVHVFVTNVPGPAVPLYALGARLWEVAPIVPLAGNVTISVAALSYDGRLVLAVHADADACPDVDVAVAGVESVLDELSEASDRLR